MLTWNYDFIASKPKPARPPPPKTEPSNIAPPNWNVPTSVAPQQMNMPQGQPEGQLPYPAYTAYPYPYPAAPYNPYGQIVMPPFPPGKYSHIKVSVHFSMWFSD